MKCKLMLVILQVAIIFSAFAEPPSLTHTNGSSIPMGKFEEFYKAAVNGDLETLRELLKSNPSLVSSIDKYGFTALHGAAGEENIKVVDYLLSAGASINATNNEGISPLHVAIYPDMVTFLVRRGADINLQDKDGNTPLHTFAGEAEGLETMQILLTAGANTNIKNKIGLTPSDIATSRGESNKIELIKKFSK